MTHPNKLKGDRAEREAAIILADLTGWPVKRRRNLGTHEDIGDIIGIPDTIVQVASWADALRAIREKPVAAEVQRANAGATFAVTLVRLRGGTWRAVLTPEQLCTLLREAVGMARIASPRRVGGPEMQAIRAYLRAERDEWCCEDCWRTDAMSGEPRLPKAVADWVLG